MNKKQRHWFMLTLTHRDPTQNDEFNLNWSSPEEIKKI